MAQADLDRLDEHLRLCERLLEHEAELSVAQTALVRRSFSGRPSPPIVEHPSACSWSSRLRTARNLRPSAPSMRAALQPSPAIAADDSEPTGTAAEAAMYDPLLADADDEAPTPAPTPAGFSGSDLAGGQHPQWTLAGSFAVYAAARCRIPMRTMCTPLCVRLS